MEGREDLSFGFTLNDGATETYRIAPRNENFNLFGGPTPPVASPAAIVAPSASAPAQPQVKSPPPPPASAQIPVTLPVLAASPVSGAAGVAVTADGKKKRGRPRKYGPDGKLAMPLCPMPISSSVPLTGDFSGWKRGRGRPGDSIKKSHKLDTHKQLQPEGSGERIDYNAGANFTPHMITVNAGEDVTMKIMLFSQQGTRAICILSANGMISNVTLRQPTSSGGTLTYEGRFEILSLSGSFMPTDNGGTKSRSGGMSVSLAGPDGRVLGGGLAGLLVAASPVQVIVGSFVAGNQQEHKVKKHRIETASTVIPSSTNLVFGENPKGVYGGAKPILSSFNGAPSPMQGGFGNSPADNNISFSEDDSKDNNDDSNCEVSC